jgi:L-lactate dehydrogenase complex protein LldG
MNESDFLARISHRLGREQVATQAPERSEVGIPEFWTAYQLSPSERIARFQERLEQLGGEVRMATDLATLKTVLTELLQELSPKRIGAWDDSLLNEWGVDTILNSYDTVKWGTDAPSDFVSTDVGITGCEFAIADTGTIGVSCGAGRGRSVHLLPPVHIAIVRASQIYTRLGEALENVAERLPRIDSYIHFVTGPSRSSDIENDQSIGVHGPAAVIAVVVGNQ